MKIIITEKLEEILIKNWTYFIDHKRLMSIILTKLRDSILPVVKENKPNQGIQLKISRFEPQENKFLIWVEFTVPKLNEVVEGTSEITLSNIGEILNHSLVGNVFKVN